MSAYSVNSVNKNPFDTLSVQTNAHCGNGYITHALQFLVRVLLIRIEPGHCEFGTCCVGTIGDKIATELGTNLPSVKETQSLINRDWVRPGLHGILDVRADACLPSSHPLCAGKQRVGQIEAPSTHVSWPRSDAPWAGLAL